MGVLIALGLSWAVKILVAAAITLLSYAIAVALVRLVQKVREWGKGRIIVVGGPELNPIKDSCPKLKAIMSGKLKPKATFYVNDETKEIEKVGVLEAKNPEVDELGDLSSVEKDGRMELYA